ncbi:Ig-like domain-containing protein, partial [Lyngbya sp. CCY1209]|uniref:Ig-like domain-containing protein n=1 Tax=Lyngbya sp. CCY1209 TaxID=2886103 RepID=UPI002D1FE17A
PDADGEVTVDIAANVAADIAGNDNTAAVQLTRTYDVTAPDVTLTTDAEATINAPFTVTATFGEAVSGFDVSDITINNGSADNLQTADNITY